MSKPDVSADYEAGLWVPSNYGLKFRLAKKGARFPLPHSRGQSTEIDPSQTFATVGEAQAAANERNHAELLRDARQVAA